MLFIVNKNVRFLCKSNLSTVSNYDYELLTKTSLLRNIIKNILLYLFGNYFFSTFAINLPETNAIKSYLVLVISERLCILLQVRWTEITNPIYYAYKTVSLSGDVSPWS